MENETHVGASQDAGAVVKNSYGIVVGEPKYADFIYKMCDAHIGMQNGVLDVYHYTGGMIQSHIDETGSTNVKTALDKILEDMGAATYGRLGGLKIDSLRKAHKLFLMFSKEQLELAKAGNVSLRNLLPMCGNDVTPEERNVLLLEVTEGTLIQTEIPNKVKELHPPEQKKEKRGGARKKVEKPLEFMKRIQKDMDHLLTDMKESYRLHAASALGSEDEATKEEYTRCYEANAEQVEQLNKQWKSNEKVTEAFLDE